MKSPWTTGLALVAVIAAGIAWRTNLGWREVRQSTADVLAARARIEAELGRVRKQIDLAASQQKELQTALDATKTVSAEPAPPPVPGLRTLDDTPAQQAMDMKAFKAGLFARYSSLYRALGLSPEQVAKFEDLLAEQQWRRRDVAAAAMAQGVAASDATMAALRKTEDAREETELKLLLGTAGYDQLQKYKREDSRRVVRQLVSDLALSSVPLSAEQGQKLTRVLTELDFNGRAGADRRSWDAVLSRAQEFLGAEQLAELQGQAIKSQSLAALNELGRLVQPAKK